MADWWLDSDPVEVSAIGDLKFYGRNGAFRSTHCRVCPYKEQCKFHWNIMDDERYVKLYVNAESEDGYLRAGAMSSLIGIAAYRSIERDGQKIRISDLVDL